MNKGKDCCEILKNIRLQIAQENEIPFQIEACTFEGNCRGTCPRCEAELLYLEQKIAEKKQFGKRALVAGISLGLISTFSACNFNNKTLGESLPKKDTNSTITFLKDTVEREVPTIIDFNHKPEEIKSEIKVKRKYRGKKTVTIETIELEGAVSRSSIYQKSNLKSLVDYESIFRGIKLNSSNHEISPCSPAIDYDSIMHGKK